MFRKPQQQTLKADHTSRVSRCAVCIRRQVIDDYSGRFKPFTSNSSRYIPSPQNHRFPPPSSVDSHPIHRAPEGQRRRPNPRVRGPVNHDQPPRRQRIRNRKIEYINEVQNQS